MTKANSDQLAYVGKKPGSRDSNAWYTPVRYVELVKEVLGEIDLDPFSSEYANRAIRAKKIFTVSDSAFENEWPSGNMFMNPPYGRGMIERAVEIFLHHATYIGTVDDAIVLTNASTETKWFQALLKNSQAVCFTNHRINFYCEDGKETSGNTKEQAFFYFGDDRDIFTEVFSSIGTVLKVA